MSEYGLIPTSDYQDICNAVRSKTGGTDTLKSSEVATAIEDLKTEFVTEELTITENGEYTPGEGVDGFDKVTVNVAANGNALSAVCSGTVVLTGAVSEFTVSVDFTAFPYVVASAYIKRSGVVTDGTIVWDEKLRVPIEDTRYFVPVMINTKNPFSDHVTDVIYSNDYSTSYGAKSCGLNEGYRMRTDNNGVSTSSGALKLSVDGVTIHTGSSVYYLCSEGYAVEYEYRIIGFCESGTPLNIA